MTIQHNEARRYLRFPPDPTEVAYIDTKVGEETFNREIVALILDIAPKGGCSLVFSLRNGEGMKDRQRCRIQIGDMRPLTAELVWQREIDRNVYRCGFLFLE
jgi:hypothetical protein